MAFPAHTQGLAQYTFEESQLAAQQSKRTFAVNSLNDNPLLEDYDVKFYGLDLRVNNRSDRVQGNTTILVETQRSSFETLVFELYHNLKVDRVLVDGAEMSFTHTDYELYIELSTPRDSGNLLTAQVFYGGQTGEGMVLSLIHI